MKVINDLKEIPEGMSDEEEAQFWEEHEFGDGVAFRRPDKDDPELPPARERSLNTDLPEDVMDKLRELAREQGVSVRRLLRGLEPKRKRSNPIAVRFEDDTVARLKTLAERKGMGYQTLLKAFVQERLYEEEKREGVVG